MMAQVPHEMSRPPSEDAAIRRMVEESKSSIYGQPYPPYMSPPGYYNSAAPPLYHDYDQKTFSWLIETVKQLQQQLPLTQDKLYQDTDSCNHSTLTSAWKAIDSKNSKIRELEQLVQSISQDRKVRDEAMLGSIKDKNADATALPVVGTSSSESDKSSSDTLSRSTDSTGEDQRTERLERIEAIEAMQARLKMRKTKKQKRQGLAAQIPVAAKPTRWSPGIKIYELEASKYNATNRCMKIVVDIPDGMKASNMKATAKRKAGGTFLQLSGKSESSISNKRGAAKGTTVQQFNKQISVGPNVDVKKMKAAFIDGVLVLSAPILPPTLVKCEGFSDEISLLTGALHD